MAANGRRPNGRFTLAERQLDSGCPLSRYLVAEACRKLLWTLLGSVSRSVAGEHRVTLMPEAERLRVIVRDTRTGAIGAIGVSREQLAAIVP